MSSIEKTWQWSSTTWTIVQRNTPSKHQKTHQIILFIYGYTGPKLILIHMRKLINHNSQVYYIQTEEQPNHIEKDLQVLKKSSQH